MSARNLGRLAPAALVLCVLAGCYETEQEVGPRADSKVDARFVGDWEFPNPSAGSTIVRVRNINNREYYIEMGKVGEANPYRGSAYTAAVNGATFAHVRELAADGSIPAKHTLMRVALTPEGRLKLRHFNGNFFQGKDVSTSAKLRAVVQQNVANHAMYEPQTSTGAKLVK
jgi:hypothetical protein